MLLEQAFHALPEILCGSRVPRAGLRVRHRHGPTMAICRNSTARNVANPLSCIQGPRLYEDNGFANGGGDAAISPRRPRARTGSLRVAPASVSATATAGVMRTGSKRKVLGVRNKLTNKGPTAALLADLVRLATFRSRSRVRGFKGRYLLHIYDRPPTDQSRLAATRTRTAWGGSRQWGVGRARCWHAHRADRGPR